jgi:tRNA (adenine-N(1)-)-methyltransferase non-catalytic subunit
LASFQLIGQGEILIINDADSPPDLHIIESFNFTPEQLAPITSIHWAATLQDYVPPDLPLEIPEGTPKAKSIREQTKIKRRKTLFDKTSDTRASLFAGGFDA